MIVIVPMAGKSQRFLKAGYGPKHLLEFGGATAFDWAISSFAPRFGSADFVFVTADRDAAVFANEHARGLGIKESRIVSDPSRQGFGRTVYNGLVLSKLDLNQPVAIGVIDTYRPNFFELPFNLGQSSFAELCINTPLDEDRLIGHVKEVKNLREPPAGHSALVNPSSVRKLPWRRGTGTFFFQTASSFIDAFERTNRRLTLGGILPISGQSKIPEIAQWVMTLRAINKYHHPMLVRLVNRTDAIFIGKPREYELVRNNWPARFTLRGRHPA